MEKFYLRYPNFLKKAVTLSYDDGTFYDVFFVHLLDKYGLKCTFNINTGLFGQCCTFDWNGKTIYHNRISEEQTKMLYKGHELAAHSLTHPLLVNQPKEFLDKEMLTDIANIERITGKKVLGMAYPGGPHNDFTNDYLRDKLLYARGIQSTFSFDLPETFVPLEPTVFHLQQEMIPLCEDYIALDRAEWSWFYLWGHSYELEYDGVYENDLKAFEILSRKPDIWYATNGEIVSYVLNARKLRAEGGAFVNDTQGDIYLEYKGKQIMVPKHGKIKVEE